MFFAANLAMFAFQGACPHKSCAFIQWHGKAADSCSDVSAFVSAGINNAQNTYSLKNLPANVVTFVILISNCLSEVADYKLFLA
jgi:hypothetical protein